MSEVTLDSVNVELSSDSSKASKGIDGLVSSLENLRKSTQGAVTGLSSLDGSIKNIIKSFSGLSRTTSSFRSINGELKNLKNSASSISGTKLTLNTSELNRGRQSIREYEQDIENMQQTASQGVNLNANENELSATDARINKISESFNTLNSSVNLLQRRFTASRQEATGLAGVANRVSSTFKGLEKAGRGIAKNLRPVANTIKRAASAAASLAKSLTDTTGVKRTVKHLSKYLMALFSIRGTYAAIKALSQSWLDSTSEAAQQLNANINYLKFALGSAVSPIIEYITNAIYSILKVIQTVIYVLTGVNIFAKAFAKNMKSAAGSASKIKKELNLAPFDELNSIGKTDGSGSGGGAGSIAPTFDLTEVDLKYNKWVEKLVDFFKPLVESWKKYGPGLIEQVKSTASSVAGAIGAVWQSFENIITNGTVYKIIENILKIIENIANAWKNAWKYNNNGDKIIQNVADAFNNLLTAIEKVTKSAGFQEWLKNAIDRLRQISEKIKSINWEPFVEYLAKIGGKIGDAAIWILDKLVDAFKWIVEHPDIITVIAGVVGALVALKTIANIGATIGKITSGLKAFKSIGGTSKVANSITGAGEIGAAANSQSKNLKLPGFKTILKGLAELAIIVAGVEAIIVATGALMSIPKFSEFMDKGIDSLKKVFKGIGSVALQLIGVSGAIVGLGLIGVKTVALGLASLATIIIGTEAVIVAAGAIMSIPNFQEFLNKGADLLVKLAETIARIGGAFVGGFADQVSSYLPEIGKNLSEFYNNGKDFFEGIAIFNESMAKSMTYLAQALLVITAAEIMDGLTRWITGGSSMTKFGKDLSEFGPYMKTYSDSIQGLDANLVIASSIAAKALAEMANLSPHYDGLVQVLAGKTDLARFGSELAKFGPYLKVYSDSVKGVDGKVVSASASAASSLAKFADLSPKYGGLVQIFTGTTSLEKFGKDLKNFAPHFKSYYNQVKGIDSSVVKKSSDAVESIMKFADLAPKYGGIAQAFTGTTSLSVFGADLATFSPYYKLYYNYIKSIDSSVVKKSSDAQKSIAEFANLVPKSGGLAQIFTGSNKISNFGKDLSEFGKKFKEYYDKVKGITIGTINNITSAVGKLVELAIKIKNNGVEKTLKDFGDAVGKGAKGISSWFGKTFSDSSGYNLGNDFGKQIGKGIKAGIKSNMGSTISLKEGGLFGSTVKTYSLGFYAEGGFPTTGDLFLANEAGPEMVGRLGNQTAVANSDQITEGIRQAAYSAMVQALRENPQSQKTDVYIGNDKVYSGYGRYQNSQNNKYGTTTINI